MGTSMQSLDYWSLVMYGKSWLQGRREAGGHGHLDAVTVTGIELIR
jgi:hypothetical protein